MVFMLCSGVAGVLSWKNMYVICYLCMLLVHKLSWCWMAGLDRPVTIALHFCQVYKPTLLVSCSCAHLVARCSHAQLLWTIPQTVV